MTEKLCKNCIKWFPTRHEVSTVDPNTTYQVGLCAVDSETMAEDEFCDYFQPLKVPDPLPEPPTTRPSRSFFGTTPPFSRDLVVDDLWVERLPDGSRFVWRWQGYYWVHHSDTLEVPGAPHRSA